MVRQHSLGFLLNTAIFLPGFQTEAPFSRWAQRHRSCLYPLCVCCWSLALDMLEENCTPTKDTSLQYPAHLVGWPCSGPSAPCLTFLPDVLLLLDRTDCWRLGKAQQLWLLMLRASGHALLMFSQVKISPSTFVPSSPSLPFFCVFLWNSVGAKHNPTSRLQKQRLPKKVQNVHKHVLCFPKDTCQNPADASSTGKYLAQTTSPKISLLVGSGKYSFLNVFILFFLVLSM